MSKLQKNSLALLRIAMGALFLYAGVSKLLNPAWSAAGFLKVATTFPQIYAWFALPANIGWVNLLNEWGLVLLGVSLIVGLWVRWSALLGIVLMALYYFPILNFPYVGDHSFIVDEHIIYIASLLVLIFFKAGYYYGLDGRHH
ncbi:MAG: DoxX family protein [bacterium]|nr:DoxX family protein [bacterium]